jgi:hydrogenase maturation protease
VLIVDAASAGREPGTVFFIDKKKIPEDDLTTHRIPLSHLVRFLEETVGCRVILLGIEPCSLEPGKKVSRPVSQAVKAVADTLAGWMRL